MLKEKIDYYINEDGNFVFTEHYHLQRGFCCKNVCKHCPWKFKQTDGASLILAKYGNRKGNSEF